AEPLGAEASAYLPQGYVPRNRGFGIADAPLLQGLRPEDFRERLLERGGTWVRQPGLGRFLTSAPVGTTINPAFAEELVLRSVPGMDAQTVQRILQEQARGPFRDLTDFSTRAGMPAAAASAGFLHFDRKVPAILTVARSKPGTSVRSERRVPQPFAVERK